MINTPLVYVAGPYGDASGYLAIDRNIAVARDACKWLVDNGIFFLCPHMNSAHFEVISPQVTVDYWYAQDIRLLEACDAVLLVGDWGKSRGVGKEIAYAFAAGKPIFDFNSERESTPLLLSGEAAFAHGRVSFVNWVLGREGLLTPAPSPLSESC